MEPRPSERGNMLPVAIKRAGTTELQWSHVLPNVETTPPSAYSSSHALLQWSHVLPNVETLVFEVKAYKGFKASMEPRPSERGNKKNLRRYIWLAKSFNGATSFRTWKHHESAWV